MRETVERVAGAVLGGPRRDGPRPHPDHDAPHRHGNQQQGAEQHHQGAKDDAGMEGEWAGL